MYIYVQGMYVFIRSRRVINRIVVSCVYMYVFVHFFLLYSMYSVVVCIECMACIHCLVFKYV